MKTLSDHILDILQNSIQAKADWVKITIEESVKKDVCSVQISDNGCGMDVPTLQQATNPFFTSRKTRRVGLGLALLKQNAERANGSLLLSSTPGQGTKVNATFQLTNVDKPVLGKIEEVFYFTVLANPQLQLELEYLTDNGTFQITSQEIREAVRGASLTQKEIREGIMELISNNMLEMQ